MIDKLQVLYLESISALVRVITGRLFTEEQIDRITSDAVGKYFAGFFPKPKDELEARERVEKARVHILAASAIIGGMQAELEGQNEKLFLGGVD